MTTPTLLACDSSQNFRKSVRSWPYVPEQRWRRKWNSLFVWIFSSITSTSELLLASPSLIDGGKNIRELYGTDEDYARYHRVKEGLYDCRKFPSSEDLTSTNRGGILQRLPRIAMWNALQWRVGGPEYPLSQSDPKCIGDPELRQYATSARCGEGFNVIMKRYCVDCVMAVNSEWSRRRICWPSKL